MSQPLSNMALNLTPFGRWTALKRRRLALYVRLQISHAHNQVSTRSLGRKRIICLCRFVRHCVPSINDGPHRA